MKNKIKYITVFILCVSMTLTNLQVMAEETGEGYIDIGAGDEITFRNEHEDGLTNGNGNSQTNVNIDKGNNGKIELTPEEKAAIKHNQDIDKFFTDPNDANSAEALFNSIINKGKYYQNGSSLYLIGHGNVPKNGLLNLARIGTGYDSLVYNGYASKISKECGGVPSDILAQLGDNFFGNSYNAQNGDWIYQNVNMGVIMNNLKGGNEMSERYEELVNALLGDSNFNRDSTIDVIAATRLTVEQYQNNQIIADNYTGKYRWKFYMVDANGKQVGSAVYEDTNKNNWTSITFKVPGRYRCVGYAQKKSSIGDKVVYKVQNLLFTAGTKKLIYDKTVKKSTTAILNKTNEQTYFEQNIDTIVNVTKDMCVPDDSFETSRIR